MMRQFTPGQPITTADGLYEAIVDIIQDELDSGGFTIAELKARLPYGRRVENTVNGMAQRGDIVRIARGIYRWND